MRALRHGTHYGEGKKLASTYREAGQPYFVDTNGKSWARSLTALKLGEPPLTPLGEAPRKTSGIVAVEQHPRAKQADHCSDAPKQDGIGPSRRHSWGQA